MLSIGLLTWIATLACAGFAAYFVHQNLHPVLRTTALGAEKAFAYSSAVALIHACFPLVLKVTYF